MAIRQYIGARYVPLIDGDWDNTKQYEPLTVVTYLGNSYTSKTFVPVGADINDTTYWVITGNYNAQVDAYRADVQNLSDDLNEINDDRYAFDGVAGDLYIYINGVNGDDLNDGSLASPVKTIQRAFVLCSKKHNDLRIFFKAAGTYEWDNLCITANDLHVHTDVAGVVIHATRNIAFYNTHVNVTCDDDKPITFRVDSVEHFLYFDGGQAVFSNVIFDCVLSANFCGIGLSKCQVRHIRAARGGNFTLADCSIENAYDNSADVLYLNNSELYVTGDFTINANVNGSARFINATGSFVGFQTNNIVNVNTYTCGTNSKIVSGVFSIPASRLHYITDIATIDYSTTVIKSFTNSGRITTDSSARTQVSGVAYYDIANYTIPENAEVIEITLTRAKADAVSDKHIQVKATIGGSNHYNSMALYSGDNNFCTFSILAPTNNSQSLTIAVQNADTEYLSTSIKVMAIN